MTPRRFQSDVRSLMIRCLTGIETELVGFRRSPPEDLIRSGSWYPDSSTEYCHRCGRRLSPHVLVCRDCPDREQHWRSIVRIGSYETPLSDWIRAMKFDRWHAMGRALGVRLSHAVRSHPTASRLSRPLVAPVPMPAGRMFARGIDHTGVLAGALSATSRLECCHPLRQRRGATQAGRSLSQRQRRANPFRPSWSISRVCGRHVILVDDVLTSGRTAHQAARVLRRHGARGVVVAVVAVVETPGVEGH